MKRLHTFDLATGLLTGRVFSESVDSPVFRQMENAAGFGIVAGVMDWEAQRVDLSVLAELAELRDLLEKTDVDEQNIQGDIDELEKHLLIDYIPPSPGDDYDWDAKSKRWVVKADVERRRGREAAARVQIDRLEQSSLRSLRELRVAEIDGAPRPEVSAARLKQIEDQIAVLRAELEPARESAEDAGRP